MGKPRLTEFLLKLATDSELLAMYDSFNHHDRRVMMRGAGLSPPQIQAMLDNDDDEITLQIQAEMPAGNVQRGGNHFTIQLMLKLPDNTA